MEKLAKRESRPQGQGTIPPFVNMGQGGAGISGSRKAEVQENTAVVDPGVSANVGLRLLSIKELSETLMAVRDTMKSLCEGGQIAPALCFLEMLEGASFSFIESLCQMLLVTPEQLGEINQRLSDAKTAAEFGSINSELCAMAEMVMAASKGLELHKEPYGNANS